MQRNLPAWLLILLAAPALACDDDTHALFACEAEDGRFIELCASETDGEVAALQYRFGRFDPTADDAREEVELAYPRDVEGSLARFVGATYTHDDVYTQSVSFESGRRRYTVYSEAMGMEEQGAGVRVLDRKSGRITTVACTERPRFYIFALEGLIACDPETPVGTACIR